MCKRLMERPAKSPDFRSQFNRSSDSSPTREKNYNINTDGYDVYYLLPKGISFYIIWGNTAQLKHAQLYTLWFLGLGRYLNLFRTISLTSDIALVTMLGPNHLAESSGRSLSKS